MTETDLLAHATEFAFHPEGASFGDREVHFFTVTVARRSADTWAVLWMNQCWDKKTQSWEYEPLPSSRTNKFLRNARFTLDEAVRIARGKPDTLSVNGKTWADFKAIHAQQDEARRVDA